MSMEVWQPGIVYLRHVDKQGSSYVEQHSCWNTGRFISHASDAALKEGGRVEVADQAAYQAARWPKK